jgi:hypothetical protein
MRESSWLELFNKRTRIGDQEIDHALDLRVYRHVPVDVVDLSRGCSILSQQLELETKCPRPGMLNFVAILERCHGAEAANLCGRLPDKMVSNCRDEALHTGLHGDGFEV